MEKQRIVSILKALAINSGVELTENTIRLYWIALKDISAEALEAAVVEVLKTWAYNRMPPLCEIRKHIPGACTPEIEHRAIAEANRIVAHLQRCGAGVTPQMTDPITIDLMTHRWPYRRWASQIADSELKWWVKDFVQTYQAADACGPSCLMIPHDVRALLGPIGNQNPPVAIDAPAVVERG
ncbi:MAG: hypothetical protein ABIL58_23415 [Pseudomonadota bacterium]